MKIRLLLLVTALLVLGTYPAAAQGPYVGVAGGVSILHDADLDIAGVGTVTTEYKTGYGFNIAAGYNFDGFRLEGEFGYKAADVDKLSKAGVSVTANGLDSTLLSYMVNGYYDVKVNAPVQPFFGAGIGAINNELDNGFSTADDTVFGYQFTAGVTGAVNKNLNLDLYYRFQGAAKDFEIEGGKLAYTSSNIFAGVRVNF